MSEIVFKLTPGKPMQVTVNGVPGKACTAASAPYLAGTQVLSDTPTNEMYQATATVDQSLQQRQ